MIIKNIYNTCINFFLSFFIILAILELSGIEISKYFNLALIKSDNVSNARYLLSTIAQCQAAIIALVITITLIGVQLTSQTYSIRILDLFIKSYIFWEILLLYFISIIYDVIILGSIQYETLFYSDKQKISLSIFLMGIAFFALIPYTAKLIDSLKPKNIIEKLFARVKIKRFLFTISDRIQKAGGFVMFPDEYNPLDLEEKEDLIIPVSDIVKKAIREEDITTVRSSMGQFVKMHEKAKQLFHRVNYFKSHPDTTIKILENHLIFHLNSIMKKAEVKEDKDSIIEIEKVLEKLKAESSIYNLCNLSIEKNWDEILKYSVNSLKNIVAYQSLEKLAERSIQKNNQDALNIIVEAFGKLCIQLTETSHGIGNSLHGDETAYDAVYSFGEIGIKATKSGLHNNVVEFLGKVGKIAIRNERLFREAQQAIEYISKISELAIRKNINLDKIGYPHIALEEIKDQGERTKNLKDVEKLIELCLKASKKISSINKKTAKANKPK